MKKILEYAHDLLQRFIEPNDIAIDMTAGNGHDTLFLSSIAKYVYAFDIQDAAINNTKKIMVDNNVNNVQLIKASHTMVNDYVKEVIGGVVFNLGYLPGSNKEITTSSQTTIKAIQNVLPILKQNGICVVVVYPGHPEGRIESEEVLKFASSLPQQHYRVLKYQYINLENNPPYVIAIVKNKG